MAQPEIDAVVIGFKSRAEIDEAIERINRALAAAYSRSDFAAADVHLADSVRRRPPSSLRCPVRQPDAAAVRPQVERWDEEWEQKNPRQPGSLPKNPDP